MLTQKRSTKIGAALIIFAILLRLAGNLWNATAVAIRGSGSETPEDLHRPTTGVASPQAPTSLPPTATIYTTAPVPQPPESWRFTLEDKSYIRVQYAIDCAHRPDLEKLLLQPLSWQLTGPEPTVLILHSHASESYTRQPGQEYKETADYRTLDEAYNMLAVGDLLTSLLEVSGICVIHDRQIHDYPSYNESYTNSRASIRAILQQYPTIQVVLDLHRDAALNADGSQYATSAIVDGQRVAQLMLVVGTNASGNYHPNWQDNLATALKLQVLLEQRAPGITRQTILRAQRFNQDLSVGALIVEVGTAGNSLAEALGAIPVLAEALTRLVYGANT